MNGKFISMVSQYLSWNHANLTNSEVLCNRMICPVPKIFAKYFIQFRKHFFYERLVTLLWYHPVGTTANWRFFFPLVHKWISNQINSDRLALLRSSIRSFQCFKFFNTLIMKEKMMIFFKHFFSNILWRVTFVFKRYSLSLINAVCL